MNFVKLEDFSLQCCTPSVSALTLSILEALGFRRRRRCRLIRREELCSVELLNLKPKKKSQHVLSERIRTHGNNSGDKGRQIHGAVRRKEHIFRHSFKNFLF